MSFVGGKLKLKGASELHGVKKKKKKSGVTQEVAQASLMETAGVDKPADGVHSKANEGKKATETIDGFVPPPPADRRTEAEKRFEEHLLKYEEQRLKKAAAKSHRERVKELNEKLATLTEHHDIPRISYSYM